MSGSVRVSAIVLGLALLASTAQAQHPINAGGRVLNSLAEGDTVLPDGSLADCYALPTVVGQRYQVVMASDAFDPYLMAGPGVCGDALMDLVNNDLTAPDTTAGMAFVAEATSYAIMASSFQPGGTGTYLLVVRQ